MALSQMSDSGVAPRAKQTHPAMLGSAPAASQTAALPGACMLPPRRASSSPAGAPPGTAPQLVLPQGNSSELTPNQTVPNVPPLSRLSLRQT